ncbi:hypothetical protein [Pseudomonas helmanticensis]|uniref:glycine-rich domain-containing protein n=1 Tax=Pseudomonas helmanticensis TaxID=1471381 RepID=UPI003802CCDA
MDYPVSVPSIGLVGGKFADEDPTAGTPGSLIPAQWGNAVTDEILKVIVGAGLVPNENNNTQLEAAIRSISKQPVVLASAGAANAYTATNSPALTSIPTRYIQSISISNANTGPSTFAPDGLPAKPIYGLGLQPLQGGELPVGACVLMYLVQAGVNSGSGAWIIIYAPGGASQIVKGTKTNHAVNLSQLGSYSNLLGVSSNTALGSNNLGTIVVVTAAGTTQTLPPVAGLVPGSAITIAAWAACTVKGSGAETIANNVGGSSNTFSLFAGDEVTLASNGSSWYISSYSAAAGRLLNVQTFSTAGTFTYTATPGTASVVPKVQAAGGGGGGCAAVAGGQASVASSGHAGGYTEGRFTSGFAGATITVGAPGAAGPAGANNGGNGGSSSFGALLNATGGAGGAAGAVASSFPSVTGTGGSPGGSSGGSRNSRGGAAVASVAYSASNATVGPGGNSLFCGGSPPGNSSSAPVVGLLGSGGGGACADAIVAGAKPGALGGAGFVEVWEYS